jgi:hypothetical protein
MMLDGKGSYYFYHLQSHFNLRALELRMFSGNRAVNISGHQPYGALITGIVKWVSPSNISYYDAVSGVSISSPTRY